MAKAEVKIINATELKPGSKYLLVIERGSISDEDAVHILKHLKKMGIENAVGLFVEGDPNQKVKIIEQNEL